MKIFIILLINIVSDSNYKKYVSLNSQNCVTQPIYISLHFNGYSQELHYYMFAVNLDRCVGS